MRFIEKSNSDVVKFLKNNKIDTKSNIGLIIILLKKYDYIYLTSH